FSPNTVCPAAIAWSITAAGNVFDTATRVTDSAARAAARHAASISRRTVESAISTGAAETVAISALNADAQRSGLSAPSCRARDVCRLAGRADEGADLVGILHAGRTLHAGGHVDATRARHLERGCNVAGIEPARQHELHAGVELFEQAPVERLAEPARTVCLA